MTTLAFLLMPERFAGALAPLNANGAPAVYDQGSLLELSLAHLGLVLAASLGSAVLAVTLAVLVTRPAGTRFLPLSRAVVNIGHPGENAWFEPRLPRLDFQTGARII